ncbi:MAG: hypothetical protein EP332_04630 [Bacteroidetes bacterium]|nr:MAG: hypothetical protein EP332_04630 [Bacteroidota bacterium]
MTTFSASRLSEGNKIFPATISIDEFGVTLRIPGVFKGKEKTLGFREISSVNIETPLVGFSKITFNTLGFDRIHATGFSKEDAKQIKSLVQMGISGKVNVEGTPNVNIPSGSNVISAAKEEKGRIEKEIELEKLKAKQERIKELKAQGKNNLAFMHEYGAYLGGAIGILVIVVFVLLSKSSVESNNKKAMETHLGLERIEDSIKFYLKRKDAGNAMRLTYLLVHPDHELWSTKSSFSNSVYFDEYWDNKRESYKVEIENSGNKTIEKTEVAKIQKQQEVQDKALGILSFVEVHEGYAVLGFNKSDGTQMSVYTDLMKDNWNLRLIDEDGYGANPEYIGREFEYSWKNSKQTNDATGQTESVLKLMSLKLLN